MRKMKDSGIEWIGEIPEGWEVVQLKRFAEVHNGREIDVEVDSTDSSAVGVYGSGGVFKYTNRAQYSGKAVLFGRKGTLGKPLYVEGQLWAVDTMYFLTYSNRLLEKFSYYQFLAFNWAPYITHTAIPSVVASEIVACYFPIPPLEEQAKIADYLDNGCASLDTILDKTRSSIEEYKKLKQAVITQAVTKGVRGKREMKDSGVEWIGEIPKYWNIGKLKYYWISVESGVSVNAAERPIDNPAQYGVLKTSSVSKFIFNPHEHKQVNNDEYSRVTCPVTADCIIVSRMNTPDLVGACGYVEKTYPNLFLPDRLWQISFKNDVSAKFIWYYLNNKMVRSYISSLSTGTSSTMQNISQGQFGNISVCLPDSNEQKEIADYLDAKCAEIDKLIAKKEQLVKELESYKKSLIYEVVTGKREV